MDEYELSKGKFQRGTKGGIKKKTIRKNIHPLGPPLTESREPIEFVATIKNSSPEKMVKMTRKGPVIVTKREKGKKRIVNWEKR
jgi:hypothetical protein